MQVNPPRQHHACRDVRQRQRRIGVDRQDSGREVVPGRFQDSGPPAEVVVADHEELAPRGRADPSPSAFAESPRQRDVAAVEHGVVGADGRRPHRHECPVHLAGVRERPVAVLDDVGVPQVQVRPEPCAVRLGPMHGDRVGLGVLDDPPDAPGSCPGLLRCEDPSRSRPRGRGLSLPSLRRAARASGRDRSRPSGRPARRACVSRLRTSPLRRACAGPRRRGPRRSWPRPWPPACSRRRAASAGWASPPWSSARRWTASWSPRATRTCSSAPRGLSRASPPASGSRRRSTRTCRGCRGARAGPGSGIRGRAARAGRRPVGA